MAPERLTIRTVLFTIVLLSLAFTTLSIAKTADAAAPAPPDVIEVGVVSSVDGIVEMARSGEAAYSPVAAGTALVRGDRIRTGRAGRATIDLADGSVLSVGDDSEIEVTEFLLNARERSAVYTLSRGKLRSFVREFSGATDVRVRTPTSVSGVKGTDFLILNRGSANVFFGKTGTVAVSGAGDEGDGSPDAAPVSLTSGVMTENTSGAAPIAPVAVEPGSELYGAREQLEAVTDLSAPVEWEQAGRLPMILARWNINYGAYLADSGRYAEALDVFRIAVDLTDSPAQEAEARLGRASVLSRGLGDGAGAFAEYMAVVEGYPGTPPAENALYSAALVATGLGESETALSLFQRYIQEYPDGAHAETVRTFMRTIGTTPVE